MSEVRHPSYWLLPPYFDGCDLHRTCPRSCPEYEDYRDLDAEEEADEREARAT